MFTKFLKKEGQCIHTYPDSISIYDLNKQIIYATNILYTVAFKVSKWKLDKDKDKFFMYNMIRNCNINYNFKYSNNEYKNVFNFLLNNPMIFLDYLDFSLRLCYRYKKFYLIDNILYKPLVIMYWNFKKIEEDFKVQIEEKFNCSLEQQIKQFNKQIIILIKKD